jgi:hypothetical protein
MLITHDLLVARHLIQEYAAVCWRPCNCPISCTKLLTEGLSEDDCPAGRVMRRRRTVLFAPIRVAVV